MIFKERKELENFVKENEDKYDLEYNGIENNSNEVFINILKFFIVVCLIINIVIIFITVISFVKDDQKTNQIYHVIGYSKKKLFILNYLSFILLYSILFLIIFFLSLISIIILKISFQVLFLFFMMYILFFAIAFFSLFYIVLEVHMNKRNFCLIIIIIIFIIISAFLFFKDNHKFNNNSVVIFPLENLNSIGNKYLGYSDGYLYFLKSYNIDELYVIKSENNKNISNDIITKQKQK